LKKIDSCRHQIMNITGIEIQGNIYIYMFIVYVLCMYRNTGWKRYSIHLKDITKK